MSEHIGLCLTAESDFQITIPPQIRGHVDSTYPDYSAEMEFAIKQGVIKREIDGNSDLLTVNFRRLFQKRDQEKRSRLNTTMQRTLITPINIVHAEEEDPDIAVWIGSQPVAEGRLGMGVTVRWPDTDDGTLNELVSARMRAVANNLQYLHGQPQRHKNRSVYAQIDRRRGETLETNPMGSCSIGTDGMIFEPSEERFEATAHNIYSREQQLICMAGAIAIAKAEELLQQGQ